MTPNPGEWIVDDRGQARQVLAVDGIEPGCFVTKGLADDGLRFHRAADVVVRAEGDEVEPTCFVPLAPTAAAALAPRDRQRLSAALGTAKATDLPSHATIGDVALALGPGAALTLLVHSTDDRRVLARALLPTVRRAIALAGNLPASEVAFTLGEFAAGKKIDLTHAAKRARLIRRKEDGPAVWGWETEKHTASGRGTALYATRAACSALTAVAQPHARIAASPAGWAADGAAEARAKWSAADLVRKALAYEQAFTNGKKTYEQAWLAALEAETSAQGATNDPAAAANALAAANRRAEAVFSARDARARADAAWEVARAAEAEGRRAEMAEQVRDLCRMFPPRVLTRTEPDSPVSEGAP